MRWHRPSPAASLASAPVSSANGDDAELFFCSLEKIAVQADRDRLFEEGACRCGTDLEFSLQKRDSLIDLRAHEGPFPS
jgi:hypothetical protein